MEPNQTSASGLSSDPNVKQCGKRATWLGKDEVRRPPLQRVVVRAGDIAGRPCGQAFASMRESNVSVNHGGVWTWQEVSLARNRRLESPA